MPGRVGVDDQVIPHGDGVRVVVDLAIEQGQPFLPSEAGVDGKENVRRDRVTEILVHWHAGRSLNEMSQSLGVDRKTLRKYVAPAVAAGIAPGGQVKSEGEWHELVRGWFPELADARLRMSTIHQRLRDEHGLAASVASFRRYVAANVPEEARRSQVTVWSPRAAEAGEQARPATGCWAAGRTR